MTAGNAEVNGAASITTNGGPVDLSFADADSLLNGNGTAPAQTGSVAADVTVTDDISVAQASDVLGTTYDVVDDAAIVASALTAGNAEVNGAASITTNGGAVDLSFTDADSLLNGNGTAPAQSGSVAADVTVTDDISVAQASDVLGTTYDVVDDAAIVASALTAGNAEVNGAASITTNGGAVDLSFADADSLLNGNGTAPAQTGSVAADVTVTDDISVADASSVLGATYDILDDAATVAGAITAGNAEVNGAASITTNGGPVDLSFADADSLLNGNGTAPAQTGSVAADVTVTGTISVAEASSVLGTTYDILDDAAIIAAELVQPQAGGVSLGAQHDEIITSGDMAGGSTMVDVFPLTFNDPDGGSTSVTIDVFGTNPDGTLLDSSNPPSFPYDTTLGVRVKSTGEWVANDESTAEDAGVRAAAPELWGYLYDAVDGHRKDMLDRPEYSHPSTPS